MCTVLFAPGAWTKGRSKRLPKTQCDKVFSPSTTVYVVRRLDAVHGEQLCELVRHTGGPSCADDSPSKYWFEWYRQDTYLFQFKKKILFFPTTNGQE